MPWLVAVLFLAGYEIFALAIGAPTLSRLAVDATEQFSYLPFLAGFVIGGLSVHFWWRWDPKKKFHHGGAKAQR